MTDDTEQTATANTSVTILLPPLPPVLHVQALCPLEFSNDKARPTRVDNEAKACLDEVALALQKEPDAKAVIVGHQDAEESARIAANEKLAKRSHRVEVRDFAAQRAVNTKAYLVTEKGIDASRIGVATSDTAGQTVENYLVPAGADFYAEVPNTTAVDASIIR